MCLNINKLAEKQMNKCQRLRKKFYRYSINFFGIYFLSGISEQLVIKIFITSLILLCFEQ